MARLQLAAGAREVMTLHETPIVIRSEADIARIADAPFVANGHTLFSAHQMGGCAMGSDPRRSVVNTRGRTTRSRTCGSPTARSSRPRWA
jgi:choline dehydrogenase-like flavoprotein